MINDIAARPRREFPFVAGTKFKETDWAKAEASKKVFGVLWEAAKAGKLSIADVRHCFFYSTSDTISYRESWKCGQYWSVEAWKAACASGNTKGLVAEHVLPREALLQHLFSKDVEDLETAQKCLWENSFVCVVTKVENQRLTTKGLRNSGDAKDPWERYKQVGIFVLNAECPAETYLMNDAERAPLIAKGLLREMDQVGVEKLDPLPLIARKARKKKSQPVLSPQT